jgi:hypothetical protein
MKQELLTVVNRCLVPANAKLVKRGDSFSDYIPLNRTLKEASQAGLSLGDFIDQRFNVPGVTQGTIDQMATFGVFDCNPERICEIGPGSGRYLVKVLERVGAVKAYTIYETSDEWNRYLVNTYGVIAGKCDGKSLADTPSVSIDLVHSHKMFPGLAVFTSFSYFAEAARVTRPNGKVVFDILSENCMDNPTIGQWLEQPKPYATSMIDKQIAIDFMAARGLRFDGSFKMTMLPGTTEYLVFTKTASTK